MTSFNPLKEQKAREKDRRRKIEEKLAKINTTPARVEVGSGPDGNWETIRRIPLRLRLHDILRYPLFWFLGTIFGGLASVRTADQAGVYAGQDALGLHWLGIPIVLVLWLLLLLAYFVCRYRPMRMRIHARTFWFDSWNSNRYTGKVAFEECNI